jgi:uncharacterized protein YjbI with pentapeptide repeats
MGSKVVVFLIGSQLKIFMQFICLTQRVSFAIMVVQGHTIQEVPVKTSLIDMNDFVNTDIYSVIQNASFNACTLKDKIFSGSLLKNNSFTNVTFENCVFFASDLEKTEFIGCKFVNCQFQFVNSRSCDFTSCKFENTVWVQGSTLYNHLSNCEMDLATTQHFGKGNNRIHNCHAMELFNASTIRN